MQGHHNFYGAYLATSAPNYPNYTTYSDIKPVNVTKSPLEQETSTSTPSDSSSHYACSRSYTPSDSVYDVALESLCDIIKQLCKLRTAHNSLHHAVSDMQIGRTGSVQNQSYHLREKGWQEYEKVMTEHGAIQNALDASRNLILAYHCGRNNVKRAAEGLSKRSVDDFGLGLKHRSETTAGLNSLHPSVARDVPLLFGADLVFPSTD